MVRFAATLNRRHKTALCATLICVGLILLLGVGIRAAVGVGLLGIAFSWALGSNYRLVHWLFVVFGVLLLVPAVGDGFSWSRNKAEVIKDQASLIQTDRNMLKNDLSLMMGETDRQERRKEQEQNRKHWEELSRDEQELFSLQAEGIFRHVLKNDWATLAGGLLLLSAGLGLVLGLKPVRQSQPESAQ
jgi:hypothetical protein